MSSESLEKLKAVRDGAPLGAKFITSNGCYSDGVYYYDGFSWIECELFTTMRSLSDIERIIELMEQVKACYEAYSRIESVKQKYNAENKQLKERLDKYE